MTKRYNKAYAILGNITPLDIDCGLICGSLCCKGDNMRGMILFYGEDRLLKPSDYSISTKSMKGIDIRFAVCRGRCNRNTRPLSCRIYPLAPRYDGENLTVAPDPRAKYICPLLLPEVSEQIKPEFAAAVRDAFLCLIGDKDFGDMLIRYSEMLDEYEKFTGRMS
ncbi:MAG: hypothetical protein GX541_06805 [Clostridiales bacterium]|nr:hypothetical protein [Clostridiales bacterium]